MVTKPLYLFFFTCKLSIQSLKNLTFATEKNVKNMIKNLVFDFGGVVVDLNWDKAVRHFAELGLPNADKVLDRYKQNGLFLELEEGKITAEEFKKGLEAMCGRELSDEELLKAWLGFLNEVSLPRLKVLEELHRKYKMYLLSNTNPYVMGWARSSAFSGDGKGLDYYFDKLYLSYQMGITKPDINIFKRMLEDGNMVPEETLFIDDGLANIEAARSLGLDTLHVIEGEDWTDSLIAVLQS